MVDRFQFWVSTRDARALGCTHHARFCGIIPGFVDMEGDFIWVSRSDLMNWIEDVIAMFWVTLRQLRGEEPDFMFTITKPIEEEA